MDGLDIHTDPADDTAESAVEQTDDALSGIAERIEAFLDEQGVDGDEEEILFADGFEDAFLGLGERFNKRFAVYDTEKCLEILMTRDGMSWEEAREFFDFNVGGAWVGEGTPVFLTRFPSA